MDQTTFVFISIAATAIVLLTFTIGSAVDDLFGIGGPQWFRHLVLLLVCGAFWTATVGSCTYAPSWFGARFTGLPMQTQVALALCAGIGSAVLILVGAERVSRRWRTDLPHLWEGW